MTRTASLLAFLFVFSLSAADEKTSGPPAPKGISFADLGGHEKRFAGWTAPEGVKLEVVAEGLRKPAALAFDVAGRPFVLERGEKDRVRRFAPAAKGGSWEAGPVVAEIDGAASILLHDGDLFAVRRDGITRHGTTKAGFGAGKTILTGFRPEGAVSRMTVGLDGLFYAPVSAGTHRLEGTDKMRADLARAGGVVRFGPDGSGVEIFARGMSAPTAAAFDIAGNLFVADVSGDAYRLRGVADAGDYGRRSPSVGDIPGALPPASATLKGAPCGGGVVYHDTQLPDELRGFWYAADADGAVRGYRLDPAGAGFVAVNAFTLLSAPAAAKFRPSFLTVGPDGALYVLDESAGRILRVYGKDATLRPLDAHAAIGAKADADVIKLLSADDGTTREIAGAELMRRGDKVVKALLPLLDDEMTALAAKVRIIHVVSRHWSDDVKAAVIKALADGDGELQRLAAEILGRKAKRADKEATDALLKAMTSEDRMIRRAAALALGRLAGPGTADALTASLSFDDGRDPVYRDGLVRGLDLLGKAGVDALMNLADSGVQKDTDKVVEVFASMRSKAAFDGLVTLLKHMHVTSPQRADLIRAARFIADGASFDAVAEWVAAEKALPAAVKVALAETMGKEGVVYSFKGAKVLEALRKDEDAEVRKAAEKK